MIVPYLTSRQIDRSGLSLANLIYRIQNPYLFLLGTARQVRIFTCCFYPFSIS